MDLCFLWGYSQALHQIELYACFTECDYALEVKRPGLYNCMDIKIEQHVALPKHIYSVTLLSTERVCTGHWNHVSSYF